MATKTQNQAKGAKAKTTTGKDRWGFTKGTVTARAAGMYARMQGATGGEIKKACGAPQRNLLVAAEKRGHTVERRERKCAVSGKEAVAYRLA